MPNEIKTEIDLDMDSVKKALEDTKQSVDEMIDSVGDFKDTMKSSYSEYDEILKGVRDGTKEIAKEQATTGDVVEKEIKSWTKQWEDYVGTLRARGGLAGAIGEGLPTQLHGIQQSISSVKSNILSELPFGGLIGLVVSGGLREFKVQAAGAQAARMFQQAGDAGRKQLQLVGKDIERVGVLLGKGPTGMTGDFAAAAAAMGQYGIDIGEALEKGIIDKARGGKENILTTSVALDSLFKLGAGTSARQMGEITRNFNMDLERSQRVTAALSLTARDAGTSVGAFMTSVMRSSAALRTQRIDITEVADAQLKFQKQLQDSMGVKKEFAAGYAERAIGQVSQGLSGLSVGLSAVLGERMTARGMGGGGPAQGLEAYYALREGFGGAGQEEGSGMFAETVAELAQMAQEEGRTEVEQRFFLEKIAGTGFEGSKAIVALGKDLRAGMDVDEAIKKHQDELKNAFKGRAQEQAAHEKALISIQQGIAKIGLGIFGVLVNGFRAVSALIQTYTGITDIEKAEGKLRLEAAEQGVTGSIGMMGAGIGQIGGAVGKLGKEALGLVAGPDEEEIRRRLIKQGFDPDAMQSIPRRTKSGKVHDPWSWGQILETPEPPSQQAKQEFIQEQFARQVGQRLKQELQDIGGINEKQARMLARAYEDEDVKTGKGVGILRTKAKKLGLPPRVAAGIAAHAAGLEAEFAEVLVPDPKSGVMVKARIYVTVENPGGLAE